MARYPNAVWLGDGYTTGSYTGGPWKIVLHTTETAGVPSYNNGRSTPHLTYYAAKRKFYQHLDTDNPARALRDEEGGVATNRDSVIQLEIVAYSQESVVDAYPNTGRIKVSELTDEQLQDIADFCLWAADLYGIQWTYPASNARMSLSEYDNYNGLLGHKHVPENTHWDPGPLDWQALLEKGEGVQPPSWAVAATQFHIDRGIYSESRVEDVDEDIEFHRQSVFRHRFYQKVVRPIETQESGLSRGDTVTLV